MTGALYADDAVLWGTLSHERARILMTLGSDSQGGAWQFVMTNTGAGWIKYKAPLTVTGDLHLRQYADPQAPDVVGPDYRIPEGSQVTIIQKCDRMDGLRTRRARR